MKLAYQTNAWGDIWANPGGTTSVNNALYFVPNSTETALADICAAGYNGFELFDGDLIAYANREQELKDKLNQLQLQLVAFYSSGNFIYPEIRGEELAKIERVAQFAAKLGAEHLVVGGGAVRSTGIQEDDFKRLGDGLEGVVGVAARNGLDAQFHPHMGTLIETPEQIAAVFAHTSIHFCPDTAHLFRGGGDPAAMLKQYADRITYVHLKDNKDGKFMPLGEGELDMVRIMDTLREMHYKGWLLVELDGYAGDAASAARRSKAFLHAHAI